MQITVIVPCFRVKKQILSVLSTIGPEVSRIIVVDDNCPEASGSYVRENCKDTRVDVVIHERNQGVGGAMVSGYKEALKHGPSIIVKLDGDGQMNPALIHGLVKPIQAGLADYSKGNRFFSFASLNAMPVLRLFGNSMLSFLNKLISGYWKIMDPTNGFTAIHSEVLRQVPLDKLARDYFFESDLLWRMGTIRAVVYDMPMDAVYADERSNMRIHRILLDFPRKYLHRFIKRIIYSYYLRDFNVGSIELLLGVFLVFFGLFFGMFQWYNSILAQAETSSGTVMLASLPIILGAQMLLSVVQFDIQNTPSLPLHPFLFKERNAEGN